jgi:5'(3')-deoxyribonucleotidase
VKPLPVVGCDLDDVLADFIERFMQIAADKYGVDSNLRPTSWEWDDLNMSKEMVDGVWGIISQTTDFWKTLKIVPGVSPYLVRDISQRTKLYFPTARAVVPGDDIGDQSAYWLRKNFEIKFPTVFVSNEKGPLASALKYDYFIDDRPKNCYEVKKARPECKVFMCDSTHNQSELFTATNKELGIERISGFNDFAIRVMQAEG